MQLARAVWAPVFVRLYGWTWEQVVLDLEIHFAAARHIYDEALRAWGDGWLPWAGCL